MSIWIHNTLIVTGEKGLVEAFIKKAEGVIYNSYTSYASFSSGISIISNKTDVKSLFSLESFIKPSEEQQKILSDALNSKDKEVVKNAEKVLAEWRVNKWGTRRDLVDVKMGRSYVSKRSTDKTCISVFYKFDTTYSTCDKAMQEISRQNPCLSYSLEYLSIDEGMYGEIDFERGQTLRHDIRELTNEELDEMVEILEEERLEENSKKNTFPQQELEKKESEKREDISVSLPEAFSKNEVDEILDFLN